MTTSSSVRATKRGSSSSKNSNSSNNVGAGGSQQQQQQQQQHQQHHQQPNNGVIDMALATLQPLRDLSRNWDVDVASWYVLFNRSTVHYIVYSCFAADKATCIRSLRNINLSLISFSFPFYSSLLLSSPLSFFSLLSSLSL
jgi:hypothetical protein